MQRAKPRSSTCPWASIRPGSSVRPPHVDCVFDLRRISPACEHAHRPCRRRRSSRPVKCWSLPSARPGCRSRCRSACRHGGEGEQRCGEREEGFAHRARIALFARREGLGLAAQMHAAPDDRRHPRRGRAHRGRRHPNADADQPDAVRDHRRRGLAEVREFAVHRRLQGARRAQQTAAADRRGAGARRDRGIGRQSRAGGRLSRQAPRHSGDDRDAGDRRRRSRSARPPVTARTSCSTATMFDDAYAKARELALENGYVFVHPFDDRRSSPARDASALEMLEDAPDLDTIVVPIGGGGLMSGVSHRRARAQAGHRAGRGRGRALSVDEMRDRGLPLPLGGDTLAEGIAVKQPGELTSRILKDLAVEVMLVSGARHRTRGGDAGRHRKDASSKAPARPGLRRCSAIPSASPGKKVGTVLCGGNIDTHLLANVLVRDLVRQRPHRAAARRGSGPARRARGDHRQGLRGRGQHHRDQPQPHLHPAAGQGHGDRGRRRGARSAERSTRSSRCSKRPASTSSAPRSTELIASASAGILAVPLRDSCRS